MNFSTKYTTNDIQYLIPHQVLPKFSVTCVFSSVIWVKIRSNKCDFFLHEVCKCGWFQQVSDPLGAHPNLKMMFGGTAIILGANMEPLNNIYQVTSESFAYRVNLIMTNL